MNPEQGPVEPDQKISRRPVIYAILIIAAVLIANVNVLFAELVWDDIVVIKDDKLIRHLSTVPAVFTHPFLASYYRPMVSVSFAVERAIWGLEPFGFHLTNLILHIANSLLALVFLRRIVRNAEIAFFAALLFAIHPVHKGIAYISDRTGVLAAFFFLASLIFYMGYRESKGRGGASLKYLLALVLCSAAFFSKEEAIMLPAAVIMIDAFIYQDKMKSGGLAGAALYLPFIALAGFYLFARAAVLGSEAGMFETFLIEPVRRLLTIPVIMLDYFLLLIFPIGLDFNPRTPLVSGPEMETIGAWICMVAFLAVIPWFFKRSRPVAFGLLWFPLIFAPMSNVIPIFPELADSELFTPIHFLYLPSIGIFLSASCGLNALLGIFRGRPAYTLYRRATLAAFSGVILIFMLLSIGRNSTWKNEVRLFGHMARMHPENPAIHANLGNALLDSGNVKEALQEFNRAVELGPDVAECHNGLGLAYLKMGLPAKAAEAFREAIRLKPKYPGPYGNLAVALVQRGKFPEAIESAKNAVALVPGDSQKLANLGMVYMHAGKLADAERELLKAIEADPEDAEAQNALGAVYSLQGQYDKARDQWERALEINPQFEDARDNLLNLKRKGR